MTPSPDSTAPEAEATPRTDAFYAFKRLIQNLEFGTDAYKDVIAARDFARSLELEATRQESGEDKALAKKTAGITCYHSPEMVIGTENGYVCAECWALEGDKDSKKLDCLEKHRWLQHFEPLGLTRFHNGLNQWQWIGGSLRAAIDSAMSRKEGGGE